MNYNSTFVDAQSALTFLQQQASYIEPQVYEIEYPDIQYPDLVPIDTSGNEWMKSKTFYSTDKVGQAAWTHHMANDIPFADIVKAKFEVGMEMGGIGYYYTLEELGVQMLIPGTNLTAERGDAARRAYEEFMERVTFTGDSSKGWTGLVNDLNVTAGSAIADGAGGGGNSPLWANKTGDQMNRDINAILTGVYTGSNTVERADTLLLPVDRFTLLANTRLTNSDMNAMAWVQRYNTYTAITNQQLTIRAVRGLETAGSGGTARMVAYRNDPAVLKLHLPMPHRFLGVMQVAAMRYDVPGIFRTGGLEIRRPGSVRYLDGI
jgi:hypothetical protein